MSIGLALGLHLGRNRRAIKYLLGPFRFATDQAAPLPATYTEAGAVGSLAVMDTGNKASIASGRLQLVGGAAPGDPGVWAPGETRTPGRTLLGRFQQNVTNSNSYLGWDSDTAGPLAHGFNLGGTGTIRVQDGAFLVQPGTPYQAYTDVEVAMVLRSTGMFFLLKDRTTGQWTLYWPGVSGSQATLYPAATAIVAAALIDDLRVTDLPAPFDTDYGLATSRLAGARAVGDTFTHSADALIEFVATALPTSSTLRLRFRTQDTNNTWEVSVSPDGSITLYEVVAGVYSGRGASAGGAVVAGSRCVIVASGSTITVYTDNVQRVSYTGGANFQTATVGSVFVLNGGSGMSEVVAWPRTVALPNV